MQERRPIIARLLVGVFLFATASAVRADDVRIKDLPNRLQTVVTVTGRTGYIAEQYEKNGLHVFTLRDDYNGQVFVRTPSKNYPVMGTTYRVVGWATKEQNGTIFLDTLPGQFTAVYPVSGATPAASAAPAAAPTASSQVLPWATSLVSLLLIAGVLTVALRRWLGRPQPEWGELFVTSGPDRGMTVPLRHRKVALGRGVSALRDVRFSGGDPTISNCHALISHQRGSLYVTDMSSNGTRIGGEKLGPGEKRRVNSGDLIHLGTRGTVVIVRLRSLAPAPGFLGRLREPSPVAEKTIMMPETLTEEPAWMRGGAAETAAALEPAAAEAHAEALPVIVHPHDAEEATDSEEATASDAEEAPDYTAEEAPAYSSLPPHQSRPGIEMGSDDDEEDSIPHTQLSPMIFSFAGHPPRGSRLRGDDGIELSRDADEETTKA